MKTRGLAELRAVRQRARRQRAMGRISKPDFDFIDERLNEVEARIVHMTEQGKNGKEVE